MTSRTSWFNKGIYRSNLRRFAWGSVLYTILLFLITVLPVLFIVRPESHWILNDERHHSLLLVDSYLYLPILAALVVPTVVALLSFRFVHSKKTSVFLHSLPISRKGIFVSTLLADFTLMAVPVVVNGILLAILSLCGYGMLFGLGSCLVWAALNLLAQVLMFSVAAFACMLTGNTFAAVVLNALVHLLMLVTAASFSSLSQAFLYGFYNQNEFLNATVEWNFVAYLIGMCENFPYENFAWGKLLLMLVCAGVLYFLSWLLYRARRLETAEDVAGYRCLNPIFKYLVTFLAALGTFAISCYGIGETPTFCILIVGIISVVVYFASEMILKKSMKVWRSYKGYLVFAAAFTAMSCIFAFTSFFGYETRVPSLEDVESVAVYQFQKPEDTPYVTDPGVLEAAIKAHAEIVKKDNIYRVKRYDIERQFDLQLRYRLKNGRELTRAYIVSETFFFEVMQKLYASQEYKQKNIDLFTADIGRIYGVELANGVRLKAEEMEEFLTCLRTDLSEVNYAAVHSHEQWNCGVYVEYIPTKDIGRVTEGHEIYTVHQRINASFTKTISWLREHGYLRSLISNWNYELALLTAEQWEEYNRLPETATDAKSVAVKEMKKISELTGVKQVKEENTKLSVYTLMVTAPMPFEPNREYAYYLCRIDEQGYVFKLAAFYDTPEVVALYNSLP
ncbi:MAG: ABC transporter permease [Oscillospiraceae bacterium]|nr:ABC transporter permease [Oscillospiraceae bacterium]